MFNSCFNRKPVELLEDRTDVVIFSNLADSVGRVVLDTLETDGQDKTGPDRTGLRHLLLSATRSACNE